jgi:hypothetical protein
MNCHHHLWNPWCCSKCTQPHQTPLQQIPLGRICTNYPQHLHLLTSCHNPPLSTDIVPPHTLCHSVPSKRLPPWIFICSLKRKLRLPPINPSDTPRSIWCMRPSPRTQLCKICVHNSILDGFAINFAPLLSTASCLLPTSKLDVELLLLVYLPNHLTHTQDPPISLFTQNWPLHLRSTTHAPKPPLALISPLVAHLLALSLIPPLTRLPKS